VVRVDQNDVAATSGQFVRHAQPSDAGANHGCLRRNHT
jgi:hypothetical protein